MNRGQHNKAPVSCDVSKQVFKNYVSVRGVDEGKQLSLRRPTIFGLNAGGVKKFVTSDRIDNASLGSGKTKYSQAQAGSVSSTCSVRNDQRAWERNLLLAC